MDLVNVGDFIQTTTVFGTNEFEITRVTKTLAISKRESDGYEHKFKRVISSNMAHPYTQWSTVSFCVVKSGSLKRIKG